MEQKLRRFKFETIEMEMNISTLRDALTAIGLSSNTPGVRGDERRVILQGLFSFKNKRNLIKCHE